MSRKGFLVESKAYMNHPDHWHEQNHADVLVGGWTAASRQRAKVKFWLAFPRAWLRFHWFILRDSCYALARG